MYTHYVYPTYIPHTCIHMHMHALCTHNPHMCTHLCTYHVLIYPVYTWHIHATHVYTSYTHRDLHVLYTTHMQTHTHMHTQSIQWDYNSFFLGFFKKLFIWLHWVLVMAHRILWGLSLWSMDSLVAAYGLSSCYMWAPEHADSVCGTRT